MSRPNYLNEDGIMRRIPDSRWEALKDQIVAKYRASTIDATMKYMEREFNFKASRRQYVHRFHKWNISKYKGGQPSAAPSYQTSAPSPQATSPRDDNDPEATSTALAGPSVSNITASNPHSEHFLSYHEPRMITSRHKDSPKLVNPRVHVGIPQPGREGDQLHGVGTTVFYACPFRKRNPHRFNIRDYQFCAIDGFNSIRLVVDHVLQMHSQEHRCPRCHVFFTSRGLLETHAQLPPEELCQVVSERQFSFEDRVGFEQAWSLKEHMASETMTWQTLWNILFPEDPNYNIPPPSYQPVIEDFEIEQSFREHAEKRIIPILSDLQDLAANLSQDTNKSWIMAKIDEAISETRQLSKLSEQGANF